MSGQPESTITKQSRSRISEFNWCKSTNTTVCTRESGTQQPAASTQQLVRLAARPEAAVVRAQETVFAMNYAPAARNVAARGVQYVVDWLLAKMLFRSEYTQIGMAALL
eukprot:6200577-Pleurochrysis_carterae.AAC.5